MSIGKAVEISLWAMIFIVLVISGWKRLDPDFGWHVKEGEWIINNRQIPKTDPFSYTMPSFAFIDHEWVTNAVMYLMYEKLGKFYMAVIFAAVVMAVFFISLQSTKTSWLTLIPGLLAGSSFIAIAGVRPQIIDWLMLALLLFMWEGEDRWRKTRFLYPLMMLVWANIHGGFATGIFILGFLIGVSWIMRERQGLIKNIMVWTAGCLATLINPYGGRLWYEVWQQMSESGYFRKTIVEWQPFYAAINMGFFILSTLLAVLVFRYRKEIPAWKLALLVLLFIFGLSSLRHMPLFIVAALPETNRLIGRFIIEIKQINKTALDRAYGFFHLILGIAVILFVIDAFTLIKSTNNFLYPEGAVKYIKDTRLPGKLFNPYGWGGYLIWQLPGKKVFIDGRMASWQRISAPAGESLWIFKEYNEANAHDSYPALINKYNSNIVLWNKNIQKKEFVLPGWLSKWLTVTTDNSQVSWLEELAKNGWKEIYSDDIAVVYYKNQEL